MKNQMMVMAKESVKRELVETGRKGVTNKQMLDAFKLGLSNDALIVLALDFPEVFKSSVKYTPDAQKVQLEKLVQTYLDPSFTVTTGKKIRNKVQTTEEPVVEQPKIVVLNEYKNKNNAKMALVAEKFQSLNEDEQEIVKTMVEQDLGITEIASKLGLTKDQAYNKIFRSKSSIYNRLATAN